MYIFNPNSVRPKRREMVDNSDLLIATEWVATLLESSWDGEYVCAFMKIDDHGQVMSNFKPVIHIKEDPTFISSLYEEEINLLLHKKSSYGFCDGKTGFVTKAWVSPQLNFLTSLVGYWALNHGPCQTKEITHIFPNYDEFKQNVTVMHGLPESFKKRAFCYILGHSRTPVTLLPSTTTVCTMVWEFEGESSKDLQAFLRENTKDIPEVEYNGDFLIKMNIEQLRIRFPGV